MSVRVSPVASVSPGIGPPQKGPEPAAIGELGRYLAESARRGASDLLFIAGAPPTMYRGGQWQAMSAESLVANQIEEWVAANVPPELRSELDEQKDLDLAIAVGGVGRFRANIHYQMGSLAAALRRVPEKPPGFETLGLPEQILGMAEYASGLVLVTGRTGHGKSTTLASLVEHINRTRQSHIITIEDPIEFCFGHGMSLIEQREIGQDSPSFASALRHVLRQRPDVILVGEMRDLETISIALTAAETGHLVLASLHTSSAAQSIGRIIDVFEAGQQAQVRTQLAASLRAIVAQTLVSDAEGEGLVPATEILIANAAIRRAIRENETHLIHGMLETGRQAGMHTMEQALAELVRAGRTSLAEAMAQAPDAGRLEKLVGSGSHRSARPNRGAVPGGLAATSWSDDLNLEGA